MQKIDILNVDVSFYKNVSDASPQTRNLSGLLFGNEFEGVAGKVRTAKTKESKASIKKSAPAFAVSGTFRDGSDGSLIKHTGLICLDFDLKDNADVKNFDELKTLISAVPFIAYCGQSISGSSYFAVVPIASPDLHREHFASLVRAFKRCGLAVDPSGVNIARKRFVSFDPESYVNLNAKIYRSYVKEIRRAEQQQTREISEADLDEINRLADLACSRGIDITGSYEQWFKIACALACSFDEAGRDPFHSFSCLYPDYDDAQADKKFDDALEAVSKPSRSHPTIGTIHYYCREAGLDVVSAFSNLDKYGADQ